MTKYVLPMYESERGWGAKVDGYCGPFETLQQAQEYRRAYNLLHNNETKVPDYYIAALEPVPHTTQVCDYPVRQL